MPFRTLSGHRRLLELLARAVAREALPPSLIFSGPVGVGKRTAALALAQSLNCETPVGWPDASGRDGCGTCGSCRRILRGVHADLVLVEPGDNGSIKVDQVREAIERSAYRPFEGRRRVVIVDEADALVVEAQNALLKTLEEPPPASVFVMITAKADLLLATVRSRCQRLRFGPLQAAEVAALLVRDHEMPEADAHAAAAAADGSIGQALAASTEQLVAAREAAADLLTAAAATRSPRRRLDGAKDLAAANDRDDLALRLRALSSLLRDLGALHAQVGRATLANADLEPRLQSMLRSFDPERVVTASAAVDRGIAALTRSANVRIVADWVALHI